MANPCDFYIHGKKLKYDEFLNYVKKMSPSELNDILGGIPSFKNIPEAPFVTDTNAWTKLGLKVALKEAVKQGADKIAWTTGEQQNDRYDLSKQVKKLSVGKNKDGTYEIDAVRIGDTDNAWTKIASDVPQDKIEDYVGKEIAKTAIETGQVNYEGIDLKVGGKGMKGFYGSPTEGNLGIVGNVAKSLTGQEPGTVEIDTGKGDVIDAVKYDGSQNISNIPGNNYITEGDWLISVNGKFVHSEDEGFTKNAAIQSFKDAASESEIIIKQGKGINAQHSIDITPEVKAAVTQGMPLFKSVIDFVESLKIDTKGGNLYALPLPPHLWNGFVDVIAGALRVGKAMADAIQEGVDYLKNKGVQNWQDYVTEFYTLTGLNQSPIQPVNATTQAQLAADGKAFREEFDSQQQTRFKKSLKDIVTKAEEKIFDTKAVAKRMLESIGGTEALWRKNLTYGISGAAVDFVKEKRAAIFGRLKKGEKQLLNHFIQYMRTIELDNYRDGLLTELNDLIVELALPTTTAVRKAEIEKRIDQIKDRAGVRVKHTVLNIGGRDVALSKEFAEADLAQIRADNPELYDKIHQRAIEYFKANRELLRMRRDEGLLTDEQYERLRYFDYSKRVYVHHIMDFEELRDRNYYTPSEIKKLEDGSEELLMNNAQYLLEQNAMSTYRAIFNNNADRALHDIAVNNPMNGLIEAQSPIGFNDDGKAIFPEAPVGKKAIRSKDEGGNEQSVLVPTAFYASWIKKDPVIASQFANIMQWVLLVKPLKMLATGINPFFALWNLPRDIGHSFFFTDTYSPVIPAAAAQMAKHYYGAVKNWKQDAKEYRDEGGMMDFLTTQGHVKIHPGVGDVIAEGFETFQQVSGALNGRSELITRLAVRRRWIDKYTSDFVNDNGRQPTTDELRTIKERSTEKARSMMDFSQGGEWVKAADNFIPYLNAAFQALRVAGRSFRDKPAETSFKILQGMGAVVALALYNMKYDDDDEEKGVLGYNAIPGSVKARGIVVMMPYTKENKEGQLVRPYLLIPVPQEFSPFKSLAEELTRWGKTGEFDGTSMLPAIETAMPPVNPSNVPPLMDAIITYQANYDRFYKEKIVFNEEKMEDYAEYTSRTPQMYKDWGKATGMSPDRTKAAVGKMFTAHEGNIYSIMFSNAYDIVGNQFATGDEKKDFQEMMMQTVESSLSPLQRRFYRQPNKKEAEQEMIEKVMREENTRRKIQEKDATKASLRAYLGADSDSERKEVMKEFAEKMKATKSNEAAERMQRAFKQGIKLSHTNTDIMVDILYLDSNPEIRARAFFQVWHEASEERKKQLMQDVMILGMDSDRFKREFARLRQAQ